MLISFIRRGSFECSASRRRHLTLSNPLSLFRKASSANESSKFFLFLGTIFSPLFQKGAREGGSSLKHAAGRLDRIVRNWFNGNLVLIHQGEQDFSPRLEPDLFAYLGRDHDLTFGQDFNCRHKDSPISARVKRRVKTYNNARIMSTCDWDYDLPPGPAECVSIGVSATSQLLLGQGEREDPNFLSSI